LDLSSFPPLAVGMSGIPELTALDAQALALPAMGDLRRVFLVFLFSYGVVGVVEVSVPRL